MKLIKMVDFVIKQDNNDLSEQKIESIFNYANFLKQPLKLEMFVPCDDDGNVLEEPIINDSVKIWTYQEAKEKVFFEGFNYDVAEFCEEPTLLLEDENGNYFCYECEDKSFSKDDEHWYSTIEDLIKFDLTLTQSAIKKLGL